MPEKPFPQRPDRTGWTTNVHVVAVHDGDTLTVEVIHRLHVRLLDCWAAELKQKGGPEARDNLASIALNKSGVLWIPGDAQSDVGKSFTFGRTLGHLWLNNQVQSVSEQQVRSGFATLLK